MLKASDSVGIEMTVADARAIWHLLNATDKQLEAFVGAYNYRYYNENMADRVLTRLKTNIYVRWSKFDDECRKLNIDVHKHYNAPVVEVVVKVNGVVSTKPISAETARNLGVIE